MYLAFINSLDSEKPSFWNENRANLVACYSSDETEEYIEIYREPKFFFGQGIYRWGYIFDGEFCVKEIGVVFSINILREFERRYFDGKWYLSDDEEDNNSNNITADDVMERLLM